ncbi:hypothetical protein [Hymenobacter cavernae]|uniref:Phage protein n=1 Tax=Hymenobacter cavernae TaxID=2044852 RepID=A0ABQ1UNJ3_9BACT|nr:hypothetical protein [Hymenobacter cavernae]GGF23375.1 hypothetical protein GCM10011383_38750 [Hymenobacter cavernae]
MTIKLEDGSYVSMDNIEDIRYTHYEDEENLLVIENGNEVYRKFSPYRIMLVVLQNGKKYVVTSIYSPERKEVVTVVKDFNGEITGARMQIDEFEKLFANN